MPARILVGQQILSGIRPPSTKCSVVDVMSSDRNGWKAGVKELARGRLRFVAAYPGEMNQPSINTDRLLLRRWRDDDVEPFAAMCSDPEVMRYIGSGATRTCAQARTSIHAYEREWEEKGFGLFAVELLEDGRFLGVTGLTELTFLPEFMPAVEIGWRFARQTWGNGFASEAAQAALDFGLQKLELSEIVGIYQTENRASGRIMEKLGMRFDREAVDPTCSRLIRVNRTYLK